MTNEENLTVAKENRQYRSSVFTDLFYEDETADANDISLYNALHEEALPEGTDVQRLRIEQSIYMNFKNDVSFGVQNKVIVFSEHQSTINLNMPLRGLMYIGRAYEQLVPIRQRYRKSKVMIPAPEFYTFYNGTEEYPAESVLRISDSYVTEAGENSLELAVKVINIRKSKNHELLEKCPVLMEYALFMECIEKHQNAGTENAIERAVKECIEKDILKDYLLKKGSEVVNMFVAEYDYKTDIEVQREEAMEIGIQQGIQQGMQQERERSASKIEQFQKELKQQKAAFEQQAQQILELQAQIRQLTETKKN